MENRMERTITASRVGYLFSKSKLKIIVRDEKNCRVIAGYLPELMKEIAPYVTSGGYQLKVEGVLPRETKEKLNEIGFETY